MAALADLEELAAEGGGPLVMISSFPGGWGQVLELSSTTLWWTK
jgi:hypothetical protein